MTFGVFMHKDGSIYDDIPEVHYQFPKSYLSRAERMVGDWIVYREPVKLPQSKGFFAVAKVERIVPDPDVADRHRALIAPGSDLPFSPTVPHKVDGQPVERDLANAQAAVRPALQFRFRAHHCVGLAPGRHATARRRDRTTRPRADRTGRRFENYRFATGQRSGPRDRDGQPVGQGASAGARV